MKRHTDMTTQKVKQLLQRFMDGTTTLEEEALLAEYFRTHEAAGEWAEYKEMFALFDNGKVKPSIKQEKRSRWWKYAGIAAAISLLISLGFFLPCSNQPEQPKLIAKADTAKTVPLTEPKQTEKKTTEKNEDAEKKENTEKNDTVNKVKEIYKTARPPKYYMAKAETTKPQPETTIETAEVQNVPNNNSVKTEVKTAATAPPLVEKELYSESAIFIRNVPTLPDYEEMKHEIMLRGERLSLLIDTTFNFNININDNIAQNEEVDW